MNHVNQFLRDWILPIGLAFAISLLFRANVAEAMYIPSSSMEPTLQVNDLVVIEKGDQDIERGDIVVFRTPKIFDGKEYIIKRVVGLPGETLLIKDGTLFIDEEIFPEPYIKEDFHENFGAIIVPEDSYFLMGDNRNNSMDSRKIGPISVKQINGKSLFRIPLSNLTNLIDKFIGNSSPLF